MPYERKGKCVYKKSGEKVGCSSSPAKAKKYRKALYANVKEHYDRLSSSMRKLNWRNPSFENLLEAAEMIGPYEDDIPSLEELIAQELGERPNTDVPREGEDYDADYEEEEGRKSVSPVEDALTISQIPKGANAEADKLRAPAQNVLNKTRSRLDAAARM